MRLIGAVVLLGSILITVGCGGPPELHPVNGKVTLGGKSYNRLIVYFRPTDDKVNEFNLGVGETDATGQLSLRSTAGDGLAAGSYRVSFSCMQNESTGTVIGASDEKADDDPDVRIVELVPDEYCSAETTPVEFEIASGQNVFEFDIPTN